MNIKLIFRIIPVFGLALLLAPASLLGQRTMDIDEIRVVAPYEPTVSDAFKINDNPRIDDTLEVKPSFAYSILPRKLTTRFELEPITAARMRGEPLAKLYQGHVRGGFGTYTTPYGEAFYNTLRSNDYALGLHLKHLSSAGTIKDHGYSGYSDNLAKVYGRKYFGDNTLDGGLSYQRDVIHYYGFKFEDYENDPIVRPVLDEMDRKDIRQRISQINTNVGFGSHHPDSSRIGYYTGLEYNWLTDRYDASEHNIRFKGNIGREVEDPFGFADQVYIGLNASTDFYHNNTLRDTSNVAVVSLVPGISARLSSVKLFAGIDLSVQSDTASYFRIYPQLGFEAGLIEKYLTIHGKFSGGLHRYSLREMLQENPFMNSQAPLGFRNTKNEITGGLKGAFSDKISYNISVASAKIEDYALFVTDTATLLNNQFTLVYDNIRQLHLRGELFSQFGSRLHARLAADYFQYSLEEEAEAWHLPALQLGLNLKYNMQDKFVLSADVFARDKTFGRTFDELGNPVAKELHGMYVDANFGIEYRYTRILSFFLNFRNVQNKSLERWTNYPSQKFHVLGGLTWSF